MPNIDMTRDATDLRNHYSNVMMQQGRVLTDDDFNEAERLDAEDARRVRLDVIGPAGSPDDGFRPAIVGGEVTLTPGTYYVGGLRLELEAAEPFNNQRDWLQQGAFPNETLTPPAAARFDFLWLEAWQQPVTATEDKELVEAALGGADTSARMRTMRRVRALRNIGNVDCADAWTQLVGSLASQGTVNGDFELVTNATLTVAPDPNTGGNPNLCSPPVNGGYLGADNQAIRVQITAPNQFTWGFDNGAPLYRVQVLVDNNGLRRRIRMLTLPKDQAHYPLEGQVVELLPWSAVLFNGQKTSEQAGHLAKVDGGYNPVTQELFVDSAPPNDTGNPVRSFGERWMDRTGIGTINNEAAPETTYFYMRVWNRGDDTQSPAAIPFVANVPAPLQRTGLQVTFAGAPRANDFWIIAARPETPNTVVPWELSTGRAPHGVRRWIAPLGIIRWPGGGASAQIVDDCRPTFLPLTRIKGCCTYTVGDGTHSYGNFSRIQDAVNALPQPRGGRICVLAGNYDESVVLNGRVNIHIHGCGRESLVRAVGDPVSGGALPGFTVANSEGITIENLRIQAGPRSAVHVTGSRKITVSRCIAQMRDLPTTWPGIFSRGDDVLLDSNTVEVTPLIASAVLVTPANSVNNPPDSVYAGNAARGGIQLAGGSDRVRVVNNIIRGGIGNGIILGSLQVTGSGGGDDTPDAPANQDPCFPCKPVDQTEPDPTGGGVVRYESAGDLYDVEIAGNRITDMGANGIGVVRFFDLGQGGDMIAVHGLHIRGNFITRCMRRDVALIRSAMQFFVGYGGIALASVTDLRILDNEIVRNGTSHLAPIVGVFAIVVQGLQLDDNRIIENGPRTGEEIRDAQNGIRGGVHIWIILPLDDHTAAWAPSSERLARRFSASGAPACWMNDNVIVAPLGRAVTFFAIGSVVVARNRLVTRGTTGQGLDLLASTVLIGNFGISNEWTFGLLFQAFLQMFGHAKASTPVEECNAAKVNGVVRTLEPLTFWPPLMAELNWSTGKTMVAQNQITLDVPDQGVGFLLASILILSLDDVGFTDNQCEMITTNVMGAFEAALFGGSVRVADNRFAETWMRVWLSAWSFGAMNTTTDNQATHCLRADAFLPRLRLFRDNLALVRAFCRNECETGHGDLD